MAAPLTTDERLDTALELLEAAYDFCSQFELTRVMVLHQLGKEHPGPIFPATWYSRTEALLLDR